MTPAELNVVVLGAMAVLLLGVAAVRVSTRAGLPSMLLYPAIGLSIGEAGLSLPSTTPRSQTLCTVALAVILAEGGLTTRLPVIRPVLGLAHRHRRVRPAIGSARGTVSGRPTRCGSDGPGVLSND